MAAFASPADSVLVTVAYFSVTLALVNLPSVSVTVMPILLVVVELVTDASRPSTASAIASSA